MADQAETKKVSLRNAWGNVFAFFIVLLIGVLAFSIRLFSILKYESVGGVPLSVETVCVFIAPIFSANSATWATYLLTNEVNGVGAGLTAAALLGMVPSYISRSVAGGIVLAGGWVFTLALASAVFIGAREYFELVRSRGIAKGMTPPPRYVSRFCSVICAIMPIMDMYSGRVEVFMTLSIFIAAVTLVLQRGNPRFAQLSSAPFGLFYIGDLPCFWVTLRCGLAAPSLNTIVAAGCPLILGGRSLWTVGLIATLISFSSMIAVDTFAYLGGKMFGRTPLTVVSPKKTLEGALAGLSGCVASTLILSKIFRWPTSLVSATAFGFLMFVGSLFEDLIESMIKRDDAFYTTVSPLTVGIPIYGWSRYGYFLLAACA